MNPFGKFFKPVQPSIFYLQEGNINYEESFPDARLADFVYCFWRLQTLQPLKENFMYRVVSDGCIDILFEQSRNSDFYITGFSEKYVEYSLGNHFDYLGIRFLPAGFPSLFDLSADLFTNRFISLDEIHQALAESLRDQFRHKMDLTEASLEFSNLMINYFKLLSPEPADPRFLRAAEQILESRGSIRLKDLDIAVSPRQLRRLFEFYLGASPKALIKLTRFQNILNSMPTIQKLRDEKIFYDEGYYDQAHFIKEFKNFYGVTPNQAFRI